MRALAISLLLLAAAPAYAAPTLAEVCTGFGLDQKAIDSILAGKMVDLPPHEVSERDLSAGFVFWVKAPPTEVAKDFRRGNDLQSDANVVASHRFDSPADLAKLKLEPNGAAEAKRFLTAAPGDELNLSSDEIAAFQKLAATDGAGLDAIEQELRAMLTKRWEAYRARGLQGIAPYARAKGQLREPGAELQRIIELQSPLLKQYVPKFSEILAHYPQGKGGAEETFYWITYRQDDRPVVTLRHRLTYADGDTVVALDREFYVSQGYNQMQAVAGILPADGGTMVFYRAHTSTDRVGGSSSAIKHSVGRKMMAKQLKAIFDKARAREAAGH